MNGGGDVYATKYTLSRRPLRRNHNGGLFDGSAMLRHRPEARRRAWCFGRSSGLGRLQDAAFGLSVGFKCIYKSD